MTRVEMRFVAILAWKHLRVECWLHLMQTQRLRKNGFSNWKNAMEKKETISKARVAWFVWCPPWHWFICVVVVLSGWILMCLFIKMLQRIQVKQDCFYLSIINFVSHPYSLNLFNRSTLAQFWFGKCFPHCVQPVINFSNLAILQFNWRQRIGHFSLSIISFFIPFLSSLSLWIYIDIIVLY